MIDFHIFNFQKDSGNENWTLSIDINNNTIFTLIIIFMISFSDGPFKVMVHR